MRRKLFVVLVSVFLWLQAVTITAGAGAGAVDFVRFLESLYPEAAEQGISRHTWDKVFGDVAEPDLTVLEKARYQPEFTTEIWDYLDARVNPLAIDRGQKMARYYSGTLESVAERFGVEQQVLLAIWSMESNYGAILTQTAKLHYVPRALATLAYGDKKRARFARRQLLATLKIVQAGDIEPAQLTGSWAGAMGHTQFIPTSFLAYGIDMDGNGKRDIWNSIPDALATAANLLRKNGWQKGKTWGYEVVMPKGGETYKDKTMLLDEWAQLGFARPDSTAFPRPEDKAVLKLPAGSGPAFLVLKNFYTLKRYNNADAYALAVGLLADRLAGHDGMVQTWPRPPGSLNAAEKFELQELLQARGYYAGKIDGYLGEGTRAAIRRLQRDLGLEVDGASSQQLLQRLRQ